MSLTLDQALETSAALEERMTRTKNAEAHDRLAQRKMQVDFAAFGMFKAAQAGAGQFLQTLGKPLAWGMGLGLPALGVGHMLLRDAKGQGEDLIRDARNQALLTAAGIGGMQGVGAAIGKALSNKQREETEELTLPNDEKYTGRRVIKMSEDADRAESSAALILVDNVLEKALETTVGDEKLAVEQLLFVNRTEGTALLRKLGQ